MLLYSSEGSFGWADGSGTLLIGGELWHRHEWRCGTPGGARYDGDLPD